MSKGFDRLARVYDPLARLVYGRAIPKAQFAVLQVIPEDGRVLVVGGGTGWFLLELLKARKPEFVLYVDASAEMCRRAKALVDEKMPELAGSVEYYPGTLEELETEPEMGGKHDFDAVCTHFFLDMFEGEVLSGECQRIEKRLKQDAVWTLADFRYPKRFPMRQIGGLMIWGMYRFFRWTCGIQARRLGDFEGEIEGLGFSKRQDERFYAGMIRSTVFLRREKETK
ncbi:MAG: class I SAM-dependent methyltransferase [Bacteroidota bacterium]